MLKIGGAAALALNGDSTGKMDEPMRAKLRAACAQLRV
jgi:hypothetical protein